MAQLRFKFNAPLNEQDSETQTYGCRANDPSICLNNGIPSICAFACEDQICKKPSKSWAKKYKELKELENSNLN